MKTYQIKLKLLSSLVTPLMSDTIFGHLCWGIYHNEGEQTLIEFLKSYEDSPPLIFSDGFPEGFLPKPLLYPDMPYSDEVEEYQNVKTYGKVSMIPSDLLLNDEFKFSNTNLYNCWKEEEKKGKFYLKSFKKEERLHNSINRLTGTAQEGILYSTTESFTTVDKDKVKKNVFDLYVLSSLPQETVKSYLDYAFQSGYGADKFTGKGYIEVKEIKAISFPEKGNRVMALSSFVPAQDEKLPDLRADIFTKFGKLGGHFASTINPFKKPIVMYKTSATFSGENKKWVGTLLSNVHSDSRIKHYAYAPLIPYQEVNHGTV